MVRSGRERLHRHIEVDEIYAGGSKKGGKRGRGVQSKGIVVIAVEVHYPIGFGRVRIKRVSDISGKSLILFICDVVEPGATILTDGWRGYNDLSHCGYVHNQTILSDSGDTAHVAMPGVHRIAALLKR